MDLVDIMHQHGLKSIADFERFPPNPLKWNKTQWSFAISVIAKGIGCTPQEARKKFEKPGDILQVFNEILRKTGLIIELQQIRPVSEKAVADMLNKMANQKRQPWDEVWVNE